MMRDCQRTPALVPSELAGSLHCSGWLPPPEEQYIIYVHDVMTNVNVRDT